MENGLNDSLVGWNLKQLGQVCSLDKAKYTGNHLPYVGMEDIESNTGAFIGSRRTLSVKSSTFRFTPDHILYGRLRPYLNKVLLPDFEGHCSTEIFPMKPSPELDKRFLFYWITDSRQVNEINKTCTGARMPRANLKKVLTFQIPLPPLPEQKRIVEILDTAFAGIDKAIANAEKNLANAKELFESYLNNVFTQKGEGWEETTIGEVSGAVSTGPFGSLLHKSDYIDDGVPLVNPAHITPSGIKTENNKTVSRKTAVRLSKFKLAAGDIVVGRRGEIGRCAVVGAYENGWLCGSGCFFIKPSGKFVPAFLVNLIQSPSYRQKLEQVATGATMKNLSNATLCNLIISLPPLSTQKAIVEKLNALSEETNCLESIYQRKIAALNELKQSLLQKAFSGELTADFAENKVSA